MHDCGKFFERSMKWTTRTAGEDLFLTIRNSVLPSLSAMEPLWAEFHELISSVSGSQRFSFYLRGTMAITALRRLLRFWADVAPDIGESMRVKTVSKFVNEEVFPGIERAVSARLARLVIDAVSKSNRPITPATRRKVLAENTSQRCYLCSFVLSTTAKEEAADYLTLEHLWPASAGGDSVPENLLPACKRCQNDKADAISWEWFNVHNLVLPSQPSQGAFKSVPRSARIARHYFGVMELCERENHSLKTGFIRLGAMQANLSCSSTGLPITFFDLCT
jgi:hypothetical protein